MQIETLVIIDHGTTKVHFYPMTSELEITDEYIEKLGLDSDNCQWMWGDNLKVENHNQLLE